MLGITFSIYLFITIVLCFLRIKWGISLYLLYMILVPVISFFSLGVNLISFMVFLALIYNYGLKNICYKPLIPFLLLYLFQLLIIPLHSDVSMGYQLNKIRSEFMSTMLLPLAMITVMKYDIDSVKAFNKVVFSGIFIAVCYTLFLTFMSGFNPYIVSIMSLKGGEFNESYSIAEDGGRVFGRISGVFTHPMTNGVFLCFSAIYALSKINFQKLGHSKYYVLSFFVILLSVFFIGVRSAIGALGVSVLLFICLEREFKLALSFVLGLGILIIIMLQIPGMDSFLLSIVDSKSDNVSGSSYEMREIQFLGAFEEIKYNYLFGKGFGWTSYYRDIVGIHPSMLAFESLFIVVLCNNGIIGILFWIIIIILYVKYIGRIFDGFSRNILITLLFTYLVYSCITGEYGYLKYFLIFYVLIFYNQRVNKFNLMI